MFCQKLVAYAGDTAQQAKSGVAGRQSLIPDSQWEGENRLPKADFYTRVMVHVRAHTCTHTLGKMWLKQDCMVLFPPEVLNYCHFFRHHLIWL